jgi:hypothetical protein
MKHWYQTIRWELIGHLLHSFLMDHVAKVLVLQHGGTRTDHNLLTPTRIQLSKRACQVHTGLILYLRSEHSRMPLSGHTKVSLSEVAVLVSCLAISESLQVD